MKQSIAIIGLGLMGTSLAERLLEAGYHVAGYDLRREACNEARAVGVHVATDAQTAVRGHSVVFLCLMTSEDRRELLWGTQSVAPALEPDTWVLDAATARPRDIVEDHARLAAQRARLVDVCVAGSSSMVREGTAVALIGHRREQAAFHECVAAFTKAQYYLGDPGKGNAAKLIVNLVIGLHRLVLAEALGLARSAGFDLNEILEVLRSGPGNSVMIETKGPQMAAGTYEPLVARLAQHAKDVDLILEYAREHGATTPLSELHAGILRELCDAGFAERDNTAVFEAFLT